MSHDLHLDPETLRRLQAGQVTAAEARSWAAHLASDCARCEELLAGDGPAGPLDGAADAALAGLAPPRPEEAGNDLEYARIQRALRGGRARPAGRAVAFLAVAAMALVGAGVVFQVARGPRSGWDGVKGPAPAAVPASLRFAVAGPGGSAVERGATGQVLAADRSLLFRIEVGAPAHLVLLRAGGGETEVVFRHRAEGPGPVDVTVDGRTAAYPLAGLSGAQRFILVAGAEPLTEADLAAAAKLLSGQAAERGPGSPGLTVDVVEITVR
jgi:hypothetical protein